MFRFLLSLALLSATCVTLVAQTSYQTLPRGFDTTPGNSSTAFPQNTADDQIWQWHYPASEFNATGPIVITDLAIRPKPGFLVQTWNFSQWRVTLIEASTGFSSASHDAEFARNILRSTVVRSGPWTGGPLIPLGGATVGGSVWMGLDRPFVYDPSLGNDFIIQIEKCGTSLAWGTSADLNSSLTTQGNRYGHTSDCAAAIQNFLPATPQAPIVRIAYRAATQTLPRGYDQVDGNGSVGWPVTTTNDQKWQWHYGREQFDARGPIAITEIWIRPSNAASSLNAFQFSSFDVTLANTVTGYAPPGHLPEFGLNIGEQQLVHTGPFLGGPVAPSFGTTASWVPLGLQRPFIYDPGSNAAFLIQIEKCGASSPWNVTMDGVLGSIGTQGGQRYGNDASCTALTHNQTSLVSDLVPIVRIDYTSLTDGTGAISQFPWREEFETPNYQNEPSGWLNVEGEALNGAGDWINNTLSTPSANTGPLGDHTTGFGRYMYVDTSGNNARVSLLSPCLDLTNINTPRLDFWVHSQRSPFAIGPANTLAVDVLIMPSGPFVENVVTVGNLGPNWQERGADLSTFAGNVVRLRFRVNNGLSVVAHDIAIDDVRVYEPVAPIGQAPSASASLDAVHGLFHSPGAVQANGERTSSIAPGPYVYRPAFGEPIDLVMRGLSNQPVLLWTGPLNVGATTIPFVGQLDVGLVNNLTLVLDGITGTGLIPGVYGTDAFGEYRLETTWTLPPGLVMPLQGAVLTSPSSLSLTNALVLESL